MKQVFLTAFSWFGRRKVLRACTYFIIGFFAIYWLLGFL